jgi:hypothetical protein
MNNSKVADLLNKGFKFDTLKMLNETQIETLHNTVVEQNNLKDRIQGAKEELAGVDQMVNNIAAKLGEEDNLEDEDALEDAWYNLYQVKKVITMKKIWHLMEWMMIQITIVLRWVKVKSRRNSVLKPNRVFLCEM